MNYIYNSLIGGIYSESYEELSDGGPICYNDIKQNFRLAITLFSGFLMLLIMYKIYPKVKCCNELQQYINVKPNKLEILLGIISLFTFIIQLCYKLYTNRGIFMLNPCHVVVMIQVYLFLSPKTKLSSIIFISYMRWLYGPYSVFKLLLYALVFPSLQGLDLYLEKHLFWFEHIMGTFTGPIILIASGRYGYGEWKSFFYNQMFGWGTHILYQRFILGSLSMLTLANLNFTLCRPESDPFYQYIGNWYLLFAEYYLNVISIFTFVFTHILGKLLQPIFNNHKQKIKSL